MSVIDPMLPLILEENVFLGRLGGERRSIQMRKVLMNLNKWEPPLTTA